ncbi:hypothetical protein [Hahella ganghwensis]|uniref:hypothetical protein n=1 Tax=Hahella ganghwensis TaxID=286420 RepID=UPI0012F89214|nr:hypothetical protein [Hahella ganghwensis]
MKFKHTFYRYFKKPFFGRFERPWQWPDNVDQTQWRPFRVASRSGATLSGLLGESDQPDIKGAVLMVHPMGAIAKGFWMKNGHTEFLRRAGYHVMVFDLNGFGESSNTRGSDRVAAITANFYAATSMGSLVFISSSNIP